MKKGWLVLALLLLATPVWALFCQYCGQGMADDARFCPKCGRAHAVPAGGTAPAAPVSPATPAPVPPAPVMTPPPAPAQPPEPGLREAFTARFEPVNRWERMLLLPETSLGAGKRSEYRQEAHTTLRGIAADDAVFSPQQRKFFQLYQRKADLLERLQEADDRCRNGPSKVAAQAAKEKTQAQLADLQLIITELQNRQTDVNVLSRIEGMEKEFEEQGREFLVTSPYLRVGSVKLARNQPIWVMETEVGRACILHMGEGSSSTPTRGWITMYDLQYRTNYSGNLIPVVQFPPVEEKVVVVVQDPFWWPRYRHRHDRHRGPWPYRRGPDRDHGRRH